MEILRRLSEPTSSERVSSEFIITASEHEDNETPDPNARVDDEHELQSVQVQSNFDEGTGIDDEGLKDVDLTGFDKDDIPLNFGSNDDYLNEVNLDSLCHTSKPRTAEMFWGGGRHV
ncbi:hypothetical protein Lser_V15G16590 [Lactuca serriola]